MQLAEVRQFPSRDQLGVAVLLHWLLRSTLERARHPSSCGPGATVGWVGAPFFLGLGLEGRCIMQPAALKAHTETSSVWCRMRARGGGDLVLYCFRPSVYSPSFAVGQHSVAG